MEKKKNDLFKKLYIGLFLVIILIPFVGMLFYETDMTVEKRTAAPLPQLKTYEGKLNTEFFDNLDDYFNDHFAFRQEMTTIDALLTTKITQTSLNDDVIYGKNGWLYYEDTMDEYLGRNVLTDRGINNCVKSLSLMQEYCDDYGVEFKFMVAPIKAELYPDNMPANYIVGSDINNWDKLRPAMDAAGINYVDLHKAFSEDERVMYHDMDTHWNDEGAAFACKVIQESVGRTANDYTNEPYTVEPVFHSDLYGMLYPKGGVLDNNVVYSKPHEFTYITPTQSTEDFAIQTEMPGKDDSLLMFRDSYGNALVPFMADEYGNAFFTKAMPFDMNKIHDYDANIVMVELTQRHITYLWEYLPVMDAPLRDDVEEAPEQADMNVTVKTEVEGDNLIIYGNLDPKFTDTDSEIYVRITDSEYISDYEAFPVGYGRGSSDDNKDYLYGMRVNKNNLEAGECNIEIITKKDGVYYSSGNVYTYNNELGE